MAGILRDAHELLPPLRRILLGMGCDVCADYGVVGVMNDLLGTCKPCPIGQMLGTGYMRFESPIGISGLAKWTSERLDVLAVHADTPGNGQFREFVRLAKLKYKTVCMWEDWNPAIGPALARYGFTPEIEIQGDGEIISGWRWDRPN